MAWSKLLLAATLFEICQTAWTQSPTYGVGRTPTPEEVRAWDISISPEGRELPPGHGTAKEGAVLYVRKGCAGCHGANGSGGHAPTLIRSKAPQTGAASMPCLAPCVNDANAMAIHSLYATVIWDYIHRGMPLGKEGSLAPNEVYALTALVSAAQGQSSPATAKNKAATQTPTTPRTPDGHPDFQGYWSNNNATPLERPKELAARATLTDEEVAAMKKKAHELFGGQSDAAFGDSVFLATLANVAGSKTGFKSVDGGTGDYSSVWTVERDWDNRTSLITDPPDGRIPPVTPTAQERRQAALAASQRPAEGPEDRSLSERCITYGTPQLTEGYQSQYQIVQSPTSVAVMTEMIHDVRIIPLDGGPHPPAAVQQWMGDSRGHWEGDTLVVDTTNYKPRAFMSVSSAKLHVVERFSLSGPETLKYQITIDDPDVWTKPWSLMIPLRHTQNRVYEYACHEGNEGLAGILAGARAGDASAAAK